MVLEETFKYVIDNSFEAILLAELLSPKAELFTANDFRVVYLNKAFGHITGLSPDDILGKLWDENKFPPADINWVNIANQVYKSGKPFVKTLYSAKYNVHFRVKVSFLSDSFFFVVVEDVSNEMELEKKLEFSIYNDPLTGLRNKNWFLKHLEEDVALAQANSEKLGLLFFCHDNLKLINDSHGHKAGDELLCQCANRLRKFSPQKLKICRFDGNEFIIIAKLTSDDEMLNIGDAVMEVLREPYDLSVGLTPSAVYAGVALFPSDAQNSSDLLKYADIAMSNAKTQPKNTISMFRSVMQEQLIKRVIMEKRLAVAVTNMDFQVYYQPQVDAVTGVLRGFEALLRWTDSSLGSIPPDVFIPLAEDSGDIVSLGLWVLRTACYKIVEWQKNYGFTGTVSVNVSPIQLRTDSFIDDLKRVLDETGIDPSKLEVEITEGVFIDDLDNAVTLLQMIRDLGIGIALDDFGTGYSSLSYLHYLPLSTLKIDKSFIFNIQNREAEAVADGVSLKNTGIKATVGVEENIADAIVTLANKLGFNTIAEGVETPYQLDFLSKINCKTIQGFLTGKPLSQNDCEKLLKAHRCES